jgi:uncharacterized protein (TIGR00725 family)
VGPGEEADARAVADAREVGRLVARRGWVTLTGGRDAGVMAAAVAGAAGAGGLTVGILPGGTRDGAAPELAVALPTGLGEARNAVLVSAADAVVACGLNSGTASELALALRARRPTAVVRPSPEAAAFLRALATGPLLMAGDATEAVLWLDRQLGDAGAGPSAP